MQIKRLAAALLFAAATAAISEGLAQDNTAQTAERERTAQQALDAAMRERASMERELANARAELEKSAREVARLSAQIANPVVRDVARRYRFAGQRSMLGINIEDTERGVRVAGVSPNGPAAEAGLQLGDTILSIDGAQLFDPRVTGVGKQSPSELLLAQMTNVDPGESVKLRVLGENGTERDVTVETRDALHQLYIAGTDSWPQMVELGKGLQLLRGGPNVVWSGAFGSNPWGDMQLVTLTPELGAYFGSAKGLLVVRGPGNDALRLQDGDVILDIGGREPTTPEHALRILSSFQQGETLKVSVMRKQRREVLEFQMPDDSTE